MSVNALLQMQWKKERKILNGLNLMAQDVVIRCEDDLVPYLPVCKKLGHRGHYVSHWPTFEFWLYLLKLKKNV